MEKTITHTWINVLAGDYDDNVVEMSFDGFFDDPSRGRHSNCCYCLRESDIMAAALSCEFDIAILVLNNIIFDSIQSTDMTDRVEKCMQLISYINRLLRLPVVVLYGYPRDPGIVARALDAGALCAALIPCEIKYFTEPIAQILRFDDSIEQSIRSGAPHS
ncbi:MAG: hypothetical protein WBP42_10225 [Candidatus Zixiibacteriota bacterium]